MRRTFAVGDIHGCLDKLEDLFSLMDPGPDDLLVFLGDYVDRGEYVFEVIDFLIECSFRYDCVFLRGNHEDLFLGYLEHGSNERVFFANGGDKTVASYSGPEGFVGRDRLVKSIPERHRDFFSRLKWYYAQSPYLYVHAGVMPGRSLEEQDCQDLVWIRDEFIYTPHKLPYKVIFGHTPFPRPLVMDDKIGIDTGAVYGGPLTAVVLPEERFIQSFR